MVINLVFCSYLSVKQLFDTYIDGDLLSQINIFLLLYN